MKERINVNGVDIDLNNGSPLNIVVKSNILKKAEDLSASYSYTYNVPMTNRNVSVFGQLLILGSKPKVRQYLNAEYYRDEYLIFRGKVYVSECYNGIISLRFLFGVSDAIFKIKEDGKRLCDLWNGMTAEDYIEAYTTTELNEYKVTSPAPATECARYPFVYRKATEFFMNTINVGSGDSYNDQAITPSINVGALLNRIKELYGLSLEINGLYDGFIESALWLICNKKRRYDKLIVDMSEINHQFGQLAEHWHDSERSYIDGTDGNDIGNRTRFRFKYDGKDVDIFPFVDVKHKYKVSKIHFEVSGFNTQTGKCYYVPKFDTNSDHHESRKIFEWSSSSDVCVGDYYPSEDSMPYEFDAGSYPTIIFDRDDISISNIHISFFLKLDGEGGLGYLNVFDCLPGITVTSFISQFLFGCFGRFPINTLKETDKIACIDLEMISNSKPYDWSSKLMLKDMKVSHKIDNLAKHNYIKAKERKYTSPLLYDFIVDDETLEKEEDYFTSDFGKYNNPWYVLTENFTTGVENVPMFVVIQSGVSQTYRDTLYANVVNYNLNWLKNSKSFDIMQETFGKPLMLECCFMLTTSDIANLDLSRPVYLSQFGQYFYIEELSIGEETKAKLIRLIF